MKLYIQHIKQLIIILAALLVFSCEKDPEQHLELGNWYLQKGLIDESITEFREVSRLLPSDLSQLDRNQFKVLGTAHFKLALSYTKKAGGNMHLGKLKIALNYLLHQTPMN